MARPETSIDFTALTIDLAPDLLAYFTRRVIPGEDAADCVSETLLVLWRRRENLPTHRSEARAWAFGIAHRVLLTHGRGRVRQTNLTAKLRDSIAATPPGAHDPRTEELRNELARLSRRDRELIALVAWEGFPLVDAAAILQITPETARARYSRARRRLRAALTD